MHIIILGNPVDGLTFHGPFDDPEAATTWAEKTSDGEWWLAYVSPQELG